MLSKHHALHKLGQCKETKARDTVAMYASNIAANASVLCLDEFQGTYWAFPKSRHTVRPDYG